MGPAVEGNLQRATHARTSGAGLGYGRARARLHETRRERGGTEKPEDDLATKVESWVAAGIEARVARVAQAVTTSGGSGNAGITVTLGPWVAARMLGEAGVLCDGAKPACTRKIAAGLAGSSAEQAFDHLKPPTRDAYNTIDQSLITMIHRSL